MRRPWRRPPDPAADAFRAVPAPGDDCVWREADWCSIDLELTGLDPQRDEIIAVGAVPIRDGRAMLGAAYYSLARPARAPRGKAVLVHKLRAPDLDGAPTLDQALAGLLAVLAGARPVFHTAWVEEAFLGRALRRRGVRMPAGADTEVLGRRWLAEHRGAAPRYLTLSGLTRQLGFPAETPHHALGDALSTAEAFIVLAALLDAAAPQTVGSLTADGPLEPASGGGARRLGPVA